MKQERIEDKRKEKKAHYDIIKARNWAYNYFSAQNYNREVEKNYEVKTKDFDYLLSHVLGWDLAKIYAYPDHVLDFEKIKNFKRLVKKRIQGVPFHYLTGVKEFMGFDFFVNEEVLIPRSETETLVEKVLESIEVLKEEFSPPLFLLEPCTGSGAISLSIAKLAQGVKIYAGDISFEALKVANKNKEHLELVSTENEVVFYQGDLFNPFPRHEFNLIVINPPYIPSNRFQELSLEVNNEPKPALDGGSDGLEFYRKIKSQYENYLAKKGIMFLEIGEGQEKEVMDLFFEKDVKVWSIKDLKGNPRIVAVKHQ